MLNLNTSRLLESITMPLASDITSLREGAAMVLGYENGVGVARPSAGEAGERFLGLAQTQIRNATQAVRVDTFTIAALPADATVRTVTLTKTPISATDIAVRVVATGTYLTRIAPGAPADGQFSLVDRTITFHGAQRGLAIEVTYSYAITVLEASMIFGQGISDGGISAVRSIGIITRATSVMTDQFVNGASWAGGPPIYTAADGRFGTANTGTLLPRVQVAAIPSPTSGFLGLILV